MEEASLDDLEALLDEEDEDLVNLVVSGGVSSASRGVDANSDQLKASSSADSCTGHVDRARSNGALSTASNYGASSDLGREEASELDGQPNNGADATDDEIAALETKLQLLRESKLKKGAAAASCGARSLTDVVGRIHKPPAANKTRLLADVPAALPVIARLDSKHYEGKQLEKRLRQLIDRGTGGGAEVAAAAAAGDSVVHAGDTDSSDDDTNRNPFEDKYNEFGRSVKRIARGSAAGGSSCRLAPAAGASREQLQDKAERVNRLACAQLASRKRSMPGQESGSAAGTGSVKTPEDYVMLDNAHRLYLLNPRLSRADMVECFRDKRTLLVSQLDRHVHSLEGGGGEGGDWVTVGVVARKSDVRTSQKGSNYSSWTLSDLVDCQKPSRLMLFNEAHTALWKTSVGTVVAIAAAKVMKDREMNNSSSVVLSINSSRNCIILGTSFDLGFCQAKCQNGRICMAFLNKRQCSVCVHHMSAEYKKVSAKRTELQSCSGVTPKRSGAAAAASSGSFMNYEESARSQRQSKTTTTTAADRQRLASLGYQKAAATAMTTKNRKLVVQGAHLSSEDKEVISSLAAKNIQVGEFLMKPCAGSRNMLRHMTQTATAAAALPPSSSPSPSTPAVGAAAAASPRQLLRAEALLNGIPRLGGRLSTSTAAAAAAAGGGRGGFVDLDDVVTSRRRVSSLSINKQRALQLIRSRGGVQRRDPNQVRPGCVDRQAVAERVLQSVADSQHNNNNSSNSSNNNSSGDGDDRPRPGKRARSAAADDSLSDTATAASNNNNSGSGSGASKLAQIRAAIAAKSAHTAALDIELSEQQHTYFDTLEKKEMIEQKMLDTWEVKTKAVYCKQCKYRALGTSELCKTENHVCVAVDAVKRFFACKNCKNRTISLDKLPRFPCKNCGQDTWKRAPMGKERSGPKLESEMLSICGNESMYVGSYVKDCNINLEQ